MAKSSHLHGECFKCPSGSINAIALGRQFFHRRGGSFLRRRHFEVLALGCNSRSYFYLCKASTLVARLHRKKAGHPSQCHNRRTARVRNTGVPPTQQPRASCDPFWQKASALIASWSTRLEHVFVTSAEMSAIGTWPLPPLP